MAVDELEKSWLLPEGSKNARKAQGLIPQTQVLITQEGGSARETQ